MEVGDKFVKDGEVVEVEIQRENHFSEGNTSRVDCVWFFDKKGSIHVLTERDFLEQYTHYKPVYEYMFMYRLDDCKIGEWHLHPAFYTTVEDCMNYTTRNAYNFQRLDFTKRERVQ